MFKQVTPRTVIGTVLAAAVLTVGAVAPGAALARVRDTVARRGPGQSPSRRAADSSAYWTAARDHHWRSNSHFRDSPAFDADQELWRKMGHEHLEILQAAARAADWTWERPRVVDWGCGGGANAVAVAPTASQMILVDLSATTLEECRRQVAQVCDTPVTTVEVSVDAPESVAAQVGGCDLFMCFYVLELVPSADHGARILKVAAESLAPGGLAVFQFKYDDGARLSGPRRRDYVRNLANMTTYSIPEFWELALSVGLQPRMLTLVPENELDTRYAYIALTKV